MSMNNIQLYLKNIFTRSIKHLFPEVENEAVITLSNPKFGDYQCNNGISLYSQIGKIRGIKSPRDLGTMIKDNIESMKEYSEVFDSINVAPQGFITLKLSNEFLQDNLIKIVKNKKIEIDNMYFIGDNNDNNVKKNVLVDFSSPNIAKEMHVGHLRSTIIGESMCRILEYMGYNVLRVNHVGDWGTQFGMLIVYMNELYPNYMDSLPLISDLQEFYKNAKKRFDEDADFKLKSQKMVVELQSGDKNARIAWEKICQVSRIEFQKVYDRLNVRLDEYGESYYNEMITDVINMINDKGLLKLDDGAKCIYTNVSEVPLMAVKSDGGYGYDSTDLAAIYYRLDILKSDWIIYITDIGQEEHFMKIFDVAKMMGWADDHKSRLSHMSFGLIQGEDGKKFKTRSGKTVKLVDLLDESVSRAYIELKNREKLNAQNNDKEHVSNNTDTSQDSIDNNSDDDLSQDEMKTKAKKIGYSAIKYFDLKQNRLTNYKFSFDRMLDPKGNTAVYLLYAYARLCAIFRKADIDLSTNDWNKDLIEYKLILDKQEERNLALKLLRLPEIIHGILIDLFINRLTEYCYELCELLSQFYTTCRVLGGDKKELEQSRLLLCYLVLKTLDLTFYLLGIEPLNSI